MQIRSINIYVYIYTNLCIYFGLNGMKAGLNTIEFLACSSSLYHPPSHTPAHTHSTCRCGGGCCLFAPFTISRSSSHHARTRTRTQNHKYQYIYIYIDLYIYFGLNGIMAGVNAIKFFSFSSSVCPPSLTRRP